MQPRLQTTVSFAFENIALYTAFCSAGAKGSVVCTIFTFVFCMVKYLIIKQNKSKDFPKNDSQLLILFNFQNINLPTRQNKLLLILTRTLRVWKVTICDNWENRGTLARKFFENENIPNTEDETILQWTGY